MERETNKALSGRERGGRFDDFRPENKSESSETVGGSAALQD